MQRKQAPATGKKSVNLFAVIYKTIRTKLLKPFEFKINNCVGN